MSDGTKIQWSDATWNPLRAIGPSRPGNEQAIGWHCERVSPGCQHCYAETINQHRFGTGLPYNRAAREAVEVFIDEKALSQPLHWKKPRRIFVCSMTDLFGEWVPDEMIDRVFAVMALASQHTFQLLTKRPERMREYLANDDRMYVLRSGIEEWGPEDLRWPLPNVWLGVSAEDQRWADQRIPVLLDTPAAVRFISAEPLLGQIHLMHYWLPNPHLSGPVLSWVIVGGESGPGARPCDVGWIRSIVRQCQEAGVAVFYKQGGAANRCPHDRKGGHFECFPDDLKVREFPNAIR